MPDCWVGRLLISRHHISGFSPTHRRGASNNGRVSPLSRWVSRHQVAAGLRRGLLRSSPKSGGWFRPEIVGGCAKWR